MHTCRCMGQKPGWYAAHEHVRDANGLAGVGKARSALTGSIVCATLGMRRDKSNGYTLVPSAPVNYDEDRGVPTAAAASTARRGSDRV